MNKYLRSCGIAIACLLMTFVSIGNVEAMGKIDTSKTGSITIEYNYDDVDLADVNCYIYQVATVSSYGEYTPTDKFKELPVADEFETNAEWTEYRKTLDVLMDAYLIEPDYTVVTSEYGYVTLDDVATGLYIIEFEEVVIAQSETLEHVYASSSVLVSLPTYDVVTGDYNYEQVVSPKTEMTELEILPYEEDLFEISVNKIWENDNVMNVRPSSVGVTLYCDGKVYDEITLSYEDEWTYTWTNLESDHTWAVIESGIPDGYYPNYEISDNVHIIKNTYIDEVLGFEDEIPDTGVVMWPMQVLAGVGVVLVSIGLFVEKRGKNEEKC